VVVSNPTSLPPSVVGWTLKEDTATCLLDIEKDRKYGQSLNAEQTMKPVSTSNLTLPRKKLWKHENNILNFFIKT